MAPPLAQSSPPRGKKEKGGESPREGKGSTSTVQETEGGEIDEPEAPSPDP